MIHEPSDQELQAIADFVELRSLAVPLTNDGPPAAAYVLAATESAAPGCPSRAALWAETELTLDIQSRIADAGYSLIGVVVDAVDGPQQYRQLHEVRTLLAGSSIELLVVGARDDFGADIVPLLSLMAHAYSAGVAAEFTVETPRATLVFDNRPLEDPEWRLPEP